MKLRKILISFLIIALGLMGSLFGCKEKPINLSILSDDVEVFQISLTLPTSETDDSTNDSTTSDDESGTSDESDSGSESQSSSTEKQEEDENSQDETGEEITSKKTIFVKADSESDVFKQGLDVSFSVGGIVTCTLNKTEQKENCFAYDIEALYPKNVDITFSTKDKKSQVTLKVQVLQECEKIEQNYQSKNYIILGEDKQLSNSIVEFYPSTTTNRNIEFSFSEDYYGLNITKDGYVSFGDDYNQNLTEIYVNVTHKNFSDVSSENYSVSNIRFDVLKRVNDIVATNSLGGLDAKVTKLEFATNMAEENYNYQTITIKRQNSDSDTLFENIDDSYTLYYECENGLVNIEKSKTDNFSLTISQNYRDGTDKITIWAVNNIQSEYQSKKLELSVVVKTYPNYISVNGYREPKELILYDNNQSKELEIKLNNCFNSDFYLSNVNTNYLTILNKYNTKIEQNVAIKSGTTLKVMVNKDIDFAGNSELSAPFSIVSSGRNSLFVTVNVRIIKNVTEIDILHSGNKVLDEVSLSKYDKNGANSIFKFDISSSKGSIIPDYSVEIDDNTIVELDEQSSSSFRLKALMSGKTNVTIKFDNGLVKAFSVSIYAPVEDFLIDFSEEAKTYNIGSVKTQLDASGESVNLYYLKCDTTSELNFKALDKNGNTIYDKTIIGVSYEISNENSGNIVVSSTNNKIFALKETIESIEVKVNILAYKYNSTSGSFEIQTINKNFFVEVYIPIKSVALSDSYVSLLTKDSLGYEDYSLSKHEVYLSILPENANQVGNVTFEKNFIGGVDISCEKTSEGKYLISANSLGGNDTSTTGTITFNIQEFNIVYTKKIVVKISKAKSCEKVLVENVSKLYETETENYVNYLYFNLGFDAEVDLSPKVYPFDSYNLEYTYFVKTPSGETDPIKFENGKVSPIGVGECELILVPKGSLTKENEYDEKYATKIKVIVADGETVPYRISSKEDLLNLCSTEIVYASEQEEFEKRFSKNYVLTTDLDMSNVEFYPIGIYRIRNKASDGYNLVEFTGSFSGKFSIDGIAVYSSISGLNVSYSYTNGSNGKLFSDDSSNQKNTLNLGLFYKNSGKIDNLTLQYSRVLLNLSRAANPTDKKGNIDTDASTSVYFGGVSAQNFGEISNCTVKYEYANIKSYFKDNYIGGICGTSGDGIKDVMIDDCFVGGNLNVIYVSNSVKTVFVGGLVGQNKENSIVKSQFDVYNLQNSIFNKSNINSTINLTSLDDSVDNSGEIVKPKDSTQVVSFGGICAKNFGTIQNLSFYANILAYSKVGGVVGMNSGKIENCFSAGNVYGTNYVAGLCAENGGTIDKCSVMLLDDDEYIEIDKNFAKIGGETFVAGLCATNGGSISNSFVASYVKSKENHYDMLVKKANVNLNNFGGIVAGDIVKSNIETIDNVDKITVQDSIDKNYANNLNVLYLISSSNVTKENTLLIEGDISDVGIKAPEEIEVEINNSSLTEETVNSYNKFIKASENSIILYYYKNSDKQNINNYLQSYIFKVIYSSTKNSDGDADLSKVIAGFTKISSNNPYCVSVDEKGNFKVNGTGEAEITLYSLLNRDASFTIKVKVISAINNLTIYEDNSLNSTFVSNQIYVEKDTSVNIYLDDLVKQNDVYIYYEFDSSSANTISINSNDSKIYKELVLENGTATEKDISGVYNTFNAQVIKALTNGNVSVKAKLYVKLGDVFVKLPHEYSFNVIVCSGIKEFNLDSQNAQLVSNSSVSFGAKIETDLVSSTEFIVEQILESSNGETTGEYLNVNLDVEKQASKNLIDVKFVANIKSEKLFDIINKTVVLKIYAIDNFVNLNFDLTFEMAKTINENLTKDEFNALTIAERTKIKRQIFENNYPEYVKTISIEIKDSGLVVCDMQYFADGEKIKNEKGEDVLNINEIESDFIKIGKAGVLKIAVYPKLEISSSNKFTLTYTNTSNLNLAFVQVRKTDDGYAEVYSAEQINKGIIFDSQYLLNDENEQYLYVKLLTDSIINENEEFNLKLTVSGYSYYFTKTLTSKLSQNIEIYYDNAILNSNGILEGVYAKGVKNQVITVTVSKLSSFVPNPVVADSGKNLSSGNNAQILMQGDPKIISENVVQYKFILDGINVKDKTKEEYVDIYFYIDKTVNGKTERYLSNTIRLNIVEFIINSINIENVESGYLSKPVGTYYPLKITLNTTNDSSSEVLSSIKTLEEKISTSNFFSFNGNSLEVKSYDNFEIVLKNGYYSIKPTKESKFSGLNVNFEYTYSSGATQKATSDKKAYFSSDGKYTQMFNVNFGADFYIQTDIDNPVPIYSADEFINKIKENNNYILMNNIVLQKDENVSGLESGYTPIEANFASLDGNGYTITIKDLNLDLSSVQNEFNFGLWTTISSTTKVANLAVKFDLSSSLNVNSISLTNIKNLTFGTIAGINNGIIYNCSCEKFSVGSSEEILNIIVSSIISDEQTNAYIGGFVGINNGIITNSRSNLKLGTNKGFIGGFCYSNTGTISSCYYKNALIKNLGEDEKTSLSAGFAVKNSGAIKYSFVQGEETRIDNGRYLSNINLANYCLTCPTSVAGFVFENSGEIEESYANLSITSQSYSGGFVFANTGTISRCYSASLNEKENNSAHAPFIATKNSFDEEVMKTKIVDCFYLNINKSSVNDNIVKGLSLSQFKDEYYLTNFIFDSNSEVWEFTENLPTLCEANNVAVSKRKLDSTTESANGSIIYNYVYDDGCYTGGKVNPITISSEEEFIAYFATKSDVNSQYYRLINNIDFSDYSLIPTIYYTFSGKLDGNGLKISGISISAPSDYLSDNSYGKRSNAFGLFSKIEKYSKDLTPVVKNLTLQPLEVYANGVGVVGTLAGIVNNANICNINVVGDGVICQGKNIVGGVIGLLIGDSTLVNVSSSISVNSNYASQSLTKNYLYSSKYYNGVLESNFAKVSYSGGVCGVVDVNKTNSTNEAVRNISVKSSKIIGKISGLAFGLVCSNSGLDGVKVTLDSSSYLNSTYASGLVVGENRGYISRAETISSAKNESYFKNCVKFIGGIVGFNNSGTIVNSISGASVISTNEQTISAGGICGITVGGAISSVISLGDVYANRVIGGIIGFNARREMFVNASKDELKIINAISDSETIKENVEFDETIKSNNILYLANLVALNDFGEDSKEFLSQESHYIGAIIGVAHNTSSSSGEMVELTKKNSYITYNNYYKPFSVNITTTNESNEEVTITKELLDFGANNANSLDISTLDDTLRNNELKMCATKIELDTDGNSILSYSMFKNWSKNVFDIPSKLSESALPTLKHTNNVNTLKLEGEGTYENPYLLGSVSGINELQKIVESGENEIYVVLTDNIEATGKEFSSIGSNVCKFNGVFNGGNYFINGLTYFNTDEYNYASTFGLFGYVGANAQILNLNVCANFIINYSSSVNTTGIICAMNEGYIANCNTFGGMVCVAKNIEAKIALNYIGGICGQNLGLNGTGLLNCTNYALINFSLSDIENNTIESNVSYSTIFAGFICGANLNGAIINKCENKATANIDLNRANGDKTLIVTNVVDFGTSVNNVGTIAGYVGENSLVYGENSNFTHIEIISED